MSTPPLRKGRVALLLALLGVMAAVLACSIYANLAFAVTNPASYGYFPPFKPNFNANANRHLGGEYFQMARALAAGEGFAHPMDRPTGSTAWQPPLLPLFLAALLWATDGDRDMVMAVVLLLQAAVLSGTGFLLIVLVLQTCRRIGALVAAITFILAIVIEFRLWFQLTHDSWLVLLALDLLVAGLCWLPVFQGWKPAAGWGLFGGVCAMINPIVGFTWGICSLGVGLRHRQWSRLALALLCAGLALAPWTIRNYLVFGRLIPVKSNLAFEMFQSQCLQPDGLLLKFINHTYRTSNPEGRTYKALGETAYLDRKRAQFWESVGADPLGFLDRVAYRFFAATLWYVPFGGGGQRRAWDIWTCRLVHPLPFLALVLLAYSAIFKRLSGGQWAVIAVYLLYLMPYVSVSYYERYAMPLLAVKLLLVLWAADRLLMLRAARAEVGRDRRSKSVARASSAAAAVDYEKLLRRVS